MCLFEPDGPLKFEGFNTTRGSFRTKSTLYVADSVGGVGFVPVGGRIPFVFESPSS